MQRRLAIAFVLTALVSILLVGFGILAIAQVGARNRAEDQVQRGLNVVGSLLESEARPARQLQAVIPQNRRDLGLEVLEPVVLGDDGSVRSLGFGGRGRGNPLRSLPGLSIDADQLAALAADETVLVDHDDAVVGLRPLAIATDPATATQLRFALLAAQPVTAVPRRTVVWFLLSSAIVLVGALVAGILLARRLVHPIRAIEATTAALAAGQLDARVRIHGEDIDGTSGGPGGGADHRGLGGNDELVQLGRSVNRMAADLERSRALDQQFLLSVSHDLRTPLTAISGYAEALRDGAAEPRGAGEVIGNQAARLDRLVGDLLDLAKLDANRFRLDLRPVDLGVVAGRTAAGLAPQAAQDGIAIETVVDGPAPVLADADRLAQAIGNLVTNAMGFAAARVVVLVTTVAEGSASGGRALVTVADDGPGFDPADLPFVFDRLYTGRARPRRAENPTGLGLAIVRELAAAMGASVEAGNAAEGGARLTMAFPLRRPDDDPTVELVDDSPAPVSPAPSPRPGPPGPPPTPSA
ncbi:MAG: HAMP domain-containing sensor histidine kinase [Actinomycetota bacterium]